MPLLKGTTCVLGLLFIAPCAALAEGMALYDPRLCYILDGFLALYGLVVTGLFIKEKFFTSKTKEGKPDSYSTPRNDDIYTDLKKCHTEDEYKELPVKRERHRNNDQVYQGLSLGTKDTYDSLQMQPLPRHHR